MTAEILRYAAFTVDGKGGNPAGVVLDATSLDAAQMQAIATEVGDSETAFLVARDTRPNVYDVRARFGFMETPDVGEAIRNARRQGLKVFAEDSSFFLGWHLVRARPRDLFFADLKFRLFAYMQRRSAQAAEFFRMPTHGVMVLATDIEL